MTKQMKMAAVALIVIAVGVGAYFMFGSTAEDEPNQDSTQKSAIDTNFLGIDYSALEGSSFRMKIQATQAEKVVSSGTFEVDKNGNVATVITQNGQDTQYRFVDGATYFQDPDGNWLKYPASASGDINAPSAEQFKFSEDNISEEEKTSVKELGEEDCASGRCKVYELYSTSTKERSTISVDTKTKRITSVKVVDENTNEVTTINYEYDEQINVVAPEGAKEFSIPGAQ